MTKNKNIDTAYTLAIGLGMILVSIWVIHVTYLMFHGIIDNCPGQASVSSFPGSYTTPTGNSPQPHALSGSLLTLLELLMFVVVIANFKFRNRNYRILTLAFIVFTAIIAMEIDRRTAIPSACSFMG